MPAAMPTQLRRGRNTAASGTAPIAPAASSSGKTAASNTASSSAAAATRGSQQQNGNAVAGPSRLPSNTINNVPTRGQGQTQGQPRMQIGNRVPRTRNPDGTMQQPPLKSSLEVAWSYSRSHAHNHAATSGRGTSPSFTERHWAGLPRARPPGAEDSETDGYDQDEETSEFDDDDDDDDDGGGADEGQVVGASHTGQHRGNNDFHDRPSPHTRSRTATEDSVDFSDDDPALHSRGRVAGLTPASTNQSSTRGNSTTTSATQTAISPPMGANTAGRGRGRSKFREWASGEDAGGSGTGTGNGTGTGTDSGKDEGHSSAYLRRQHPSQLHRSVLGAAHLNNDNNDSSSGISNGGETGGIAGLKPPQGQHSGLFGTGVRGPRTRVGSHHERYSLRSSSRDYSDDDDDDNNDGRTRASAAVTNATPGQKNTTARGRRPRMRRHSSSYGPDSTLPGGKVGRKTSLFGDDSDFDGADAEDGSFDADRVTSQAAVQQLLLRTGRAGGGGGDEQTGVAGERTPLLGSASHHQRSRSTPNVLSNVRAAGRKRGAIGGMLESSSGSGGTGLDRRQGRSGLRSTTTATAIREVPSLGEGDDGYEQHGDTGVQRGRGKGPAAELGREPRDSWLARLQRALASSLSCCFGPRRRS